MSNGVAWVKQCRSCHRLWWHGFAVLLLLGGCATCPPNRLAITYPGTHSSTILAAIRDDLYYPRESCLAGREGSVLIRFEHLRSGELENVRVYRSSGDELLDREAVRALEALRKRGKKVFWPPEVQSSKDRVIGEVEFVFRL
jgi:TonB family protein